MCVSVSSSGKMSFKGHFLVTNFYRLGPVQSLHSLQNQAMGWALNAQNISPWDILDSNLSGRLASWTLVLLLLFLHHRNNGTTVRMGSRLCIHLPRASDTSQPDQASWLLIVSLLTLPMIFQRPCPSFQVSVFHLLNKLIGF